MVKILIGDVFWGIAIIRGRHLLEGDAYSNLSVICSAHKKGEGLLKAR